MPTIQLYIAQSLDGKIAYPDGNLDWLTQFPMPEGEDFRYNEFYQGVSHLCMGRKTFQEINSFDVDWPYVGKPVTIFSTNSSLEISTPETSVWSSSVDEYVSSLPKNATVWIVGGGGLIAHFLERNQIDQMILTTLPRIIGEGISLFQYKGALRDFTLLKVDTFANGISNSYFQKK